LLTEESLKERINVALDTLSQKQKRVARLVLEDRYFAAFATAGEIGAKTGTSAATVVRSAQNMGFAGFPEMQAAIRAELPRYLTAVERVQARLAAPRLPEEVSQQVFYLDIRNVQQTAEKLSIARLEAALEAILSARRILVIGAGLSAGPALFFAHSLKVIGFDARAILHDGLTLAVEMAQLCQTDLLIAIDLRRHLRATLKAVQAARRAGAATLAITDNRISRIARTADLTLEVSARGYAQSLSAAGMMSLLNVLAAELSYRLPEKTLESLRRIDAMYKEADLLIKE
jgi:DNA-binding MurR/RpiR family transcriptional regulator